MHPEITANHQGRITNRSPVENNVKGPQHRRPEDGTRAATEFQERSKKVSFNNGVRVYRHIHINDITDDEVMNAWYMDEDITSIVSEVALTIRVLGDPSIRSAESATEELCWPSLCLRGLEFRTQSGVSTRRRNRYLGWDVVLDLQESLSDSGNDCNDESIARAYSDATRHCREEAHFVGLSDAQAIQQYGDEEGNNDAMENQHPLDVELPASHVTKTQSSSSSQPPIKRKLLQVVASLGKRSSRSGQQDGSAA